MVLGISNLMERSDQKSPILTDHNPVRPVNNVKETKDDFDSMHNGVVNLGAYL